jgi:hypothetical protein
MRNAFRIAEPLKAELVRPWTKMIARFAFEEPNQRPFKTNFFGVIISTMCARRMKPALYLFEA